MTVTSLTLPEDVPWRRIAFSTDMHSVRATDGMPPRWRSSLTVYRYDPTPDPAFPDAAESTTFLKVTASITGFIPGAEIRASLAGLNYRSEIFRNFHRSLAQYYPALSALVHVAVYPLSGEWDLADYPYFVDFQPKKRELIELVTQTGEVLTQSAEAVNIRKGTTTTDTTEMANIYRGGSFGVAVQAGGYGGSVQGSTQGEWGNRARVGTEALNMTTTDASREKRESFSHTTNLSQLYQELNSYHGGTNRALFMVNARPHIVQPEFTFVNGPRELEGIQDFFLIVRRPKRMEDICVRAILETAHVMERVVAPVAVVAPGTPVPRPVRQFLSLPTPDGRLDNRWTIPVPAGFRVNRSISFGDLVAPNVNPTQPPLWRMPLPNGVAITGLFFETEAGGLLRTMPTITVYDDHVDIAAGVTQTTIFHHPFWRCEIIVHLERIEIAGPPLPAPEPPREFDLVVTGRQVTSCPDMKPQVLFPYVATEQSLGSEVVGLSQSSKGVGAKAVQAANELSRLVYKVVKGSLDRRYEPGAVRIENASFVQEELKRAVVNDAESKESFEKLVNLKNLPDDVRLQLGRRAPSLTVRAAVGMTAQAFAASTGLSTKQAYELQTQLLGLAELPAGSDVVTTGEPTEK